MKEMNANDEMALQEAGREKENNFSDRMTAVFCCAFDSPSGALFVW